MSLHECVRALSVRTQSLVSSIEYGLGRGGDRVPYGHVVRKLT
jgi:hypothetical protein